MTDIAPLAASTRAVFGSPGVHAVVRSGRTVHAVSLGQWVGDEEVPELLCHTGVEPAEEGESWLHTALDSQLGATGIEGARSFWRWRGDPDPQSHPCVRVGDVLVFHVPRIRFPLTVPAYAEATATPRGETAWYAAFAVDIDGHAAPLPLRPLDKQSVGAALTAAIWAPTTELLPGPAGIIGNVPTGVRQLLALLDTGEALHIDWDELAAATGPGPGLTATRAELFGFREGDPSMEAR
ncbi:hypothetical protein ACWFRF_28885 [Nocardia sp. NPDC055165]